MTHAATLPRLIRWRHDCDNEHTHTHTHQTTPNETTLTRHNTDTTHLQAHLATPAHARTHLTDLDFLSLPRAASEADVETTKPYQHFDTGNFSTTSQGCQVSVWVYAFGHYTHATAVKQTSGCM